MVTVFAGGGWGAASFWRHQAALTRPPATPFRPDTLVGIGPGGEARSVQRGTAEVILYVSGHCRFCRAEVRAWIALMAAHPDWTPPLMVLAPDTGPGAVPDWLRSFEDRWILDRSGAVGRSLQAHAVPFVAVLDDSGLVVEAGAGLSSPEDRLRLAHILNRAH